MTDILTTTLPTGETVLAKKDTNTEDGDYECLTPLRYGNETQALAKIASIRPQLVKIGHRAKIVKQGGRFLVFVFDAEPGIRGEPTWEEVQASLRVPEFQEAFTKIVHKQLDKQFKPSRSSFATTYGYRMNPRSRHNHPTNTTDERYYYVS